jgi:hypothetical protein
MVGRLTSELTLPIIYHSGIYSIKITLLFKKSISDKRLTGFRRAEVVEDPPLSEAKKGRAHGHAGHLNTLRP